jgi:hypothetical protein
LWRHRLLKIPLEPSFSRRVWLAQATELVLWDAIAFLQYHCHLGLASAAELVQPAAAAAAAGAARGEAKEGLDPNAAEGLAEVEFPSS